MSEVMIALGLVAGAILGWTLSEFKARGGARRMEAELRAQAARLEAELAEAREREAGLAAERASALAARAAAEALLGERSKSEAALEAELAEARARHDAAQAEHARAGAGLEAANKLLAERRELYEKNLNELRLAQDKAMLDLREAFKALSADALKQSAGEFLRLAGETFKGLQESAGGDLARRQESIAGLIRPLEEQLRIYQQRLQQSETSQSSALGEVRKQLETLNRQSQDLSLETQRFRMVLKSNQARGRWGEETLRRVVEAAGLSAHCDFAEQVVAGETKPDMLVRLPGNRVVIVDAKVPDLDAVAALDTADGEKRKAALAEHARRMRDTIKALADKDYPGKNQNALDHVVLFLPAESLFSAALEGDPDLIVWAASRRVMLATPATLIALLRSVSVSWQQYAQTENAARIAAEAQDFYNRVMTLMGHWARVGSALSSAAHSYNDAVGSYQQKVRPSGERLLGLGVGGVEKPLAVLEPVEETVRRLPPSSTEPPGPGLAWKPGTVENRGEQA